VVLMMAPFGARGADLVVWWEKGFYPQEDEAVAEIIAAFEQETGKQVELVQPAQYEMNDKARAALAAGQPPDFLYGTITVWGRWAYEDQLADLEDVLRPVLDLFDADAVDAAMSLNGTTGQRGLYGLPMGRRSNTSMFGKASWSRRASRSPTSRKSGTPSGPSGATGCSRRCARLWAATTSGVSGSPWRPMSTPRMGSNSSSSRTGRLGSTATAVFRSTTPRYGKE
jgi:hypothetical protein